MCCDLLNTVGLKLNTQTIMILNDIISMKLRRKDQIKEIKSEKYIIYVY